MGTNNGITMTDTSTNNSISITSSSTGTGAILVTKSGTGTGIKVANSGTGFGFYADNSSTGYGVTIGNSSTGKGLYIDNAAAATGDPFVYTLGGAAFVKAKIDYLGNITGVAGTFTGQLTLGSTITNGTYTYTLPSATGTLALTSALSGYLPLTGGTLTGALSGTSATFSDLVTTTSVYRITQASVARGGLYTYNQVLGSGTDYSVGISSEAEAFIATGGTTTKRLVITSAGNVGIGTTSPLNILDVKGAIFTGSYASSAGVRFHDNVYGINLGGIDASSIGIIQGSAFEVGAANIALQPNGGNVLIGTTTDNGSKFQVTGAGTFTSTLVASGNSKIRATKDNAQTMTDGTEEILIYNVETFDTNSEYNTTTGRATIANTGYYSIHAQVMTAEVAWTAGKYCLISIFINGTRTFRGMRTVASASATIYLTSQVDGLIFLTAGDIIDARVLIDRGSNTNTLANVQWNYLTIHRIP